MLLKSGPNSKSFIVIIIIGQSTLSISGMSFSPRYLSTTRASWKYNDDDDDEPNELYYDELDDDVEKVAF